MPQPYLKPVVEINIFHSYGIGYREDSFLQSGTTHNWSAPDAGVTATTDGDILTLSRTTATNGFSFTRAAPATGTPSRLSPTAQAAKHPLGSQIHLKITFPEPTN